MSTSVRTQVKTWISDNLRLRLVQLEGAPEISQGWPGKNLGRNHVWIDRATGTWTFPFMQAGDKTLDDQFTIRVIFQASSPGDSIAETDARAELYAMAFGLLIAADPSLGGMDGLMAAWFDEDAAEGPDGVFTDEGAVSYVFVDLHVHTRTEPT